jgi:glycosyltransferase involved in cell wall biosynthesis
MTESDTICICIPTRNRPDLLREALLSCLVQTRKPDCILVGDDSTSIESQMVVEEIANGTAIPIRYQRNPAALGQNENINSLYDRAPTTHLILLHDDDLLLPNAVEDLASCWDKHPDLTAAYGKQYVISHTGEIDHNGTVGLNSAYARISDRAGLQLRDWEIGLLQQFPNDGFMILTSVAKAVRWRAASVVGAGGDFDFGLRLGLTHHGFFFLDKFTVKYRKTETGSVSGSKSDNAALRAYLVLSEFPLPPSANILRLQKMSEIAPRALMQAINHRQFKRAWSIYTSPNHSWNRRISLGGIRRLGLILLGSISFFRKEVANDRT